MKQAAGTWSQRLRTLVLGPAGGFLLLCIALQGLPLTHLLGYEYAVALAAGLWVFGSLQVLRSERRMSAGSPWLRFGHHVAVLAAWCVVGALVSLLNALRVPLCDPRSGFVLWALFGLGAVPVTAAVAMVAHAISPRWGGWVLAAFSAVSIASALAWLALQPAIDVHHLWLGHVAPSIYDEALAGAGTHVAFRLYTTAFALGLVGLLALHRAPRLRHAAIVGLAFAVAAGVWAVRGELGIERSRAWIERELGGRAELPGMVVIYDAQAFRGERLRDMLHDHEARYHELEAFWGTRPLRPLRSYVYGDRDRKGEMMGGRSTMIAKIWLGEMHILWRGVGDGMLAHEMAHLFLREDGRGPLRLAMAGVVTPDMGLTEGAAVAAAWASSDLDEHGWSAAMRALDLAPDLEEIMRATRFWRQPSANVYTLTGSFVRWLIDEHEGGAEAFRRAYGRGDFEGVYGVPRAALVRDWERWLDERPLDAALLDAARFRFDRPALFGRVCGRAVATRVARAEDAVAAGQDHRAWVLLQAVRRDDPDDVRTHLRSAELMARAGRDDVAERWLDELLVRDGLGGHVRARAQLLRADLQWARGEVEQAASVLAELEGIPLAPALRREVDARRVVIGERAERPLAERAARRLWTRQGGGHTAAVVELAVAAVEEGSPVAAHLALMQLAGSAETALVDRLGALATEDPAASSLRLRAWSAWAQHHTMRGEPERGCAMWEGLGREAPAGSALSAEAQMWLGRCARGTLPEREP